MPQFFQTAQIGGNPAQHVRTLTLDKNQFKGSWEGNGRLNAHNVYAFSGPLPPQHWGLVPTGEDYQPPQARESIGSP